MNGTRATGALALLLGSLACATKTAPGTGSTAATPGTEPGAPPESLEGLTASELGLAGIEGPIGLRVSDDYEPPGPWALGDPLKEMVVLGALDASVIEGVIQEKIRSIGYCFSRESEKNPELTGGTVVVKSTVAADGSVAKAEISSRGTTLEDPTVHDCVRVHFEDLQYPEPKGGGIVIVRYPVQFEVRD